MLQTKEAKNTEEIKRMNQELLRLNDEKNQLQEKFLKLELEYVQQQKGKQSLVLSDDLQRYAKYKECGD